MRISSILDNPDLILALIEKYETAIEDGELAVGIAGKTLEDANKEQGVLLVRFARLHAEAKNVGRLMEARGDQIRVRVHKNIRKTSDLALSERTIDKFVDGDQDVLDHLSLSIELKALEEKLHSIVEAIKVRGYALNNITRARVESVHNAVL